MKVGLVGCGNISQIYLQNAATMFRNIEIIKCADLKKDAAQKCAEKWGIEAVSIDNLLADKEIEIVLNLTTPQSHVEIDLAALQFSKHVYAEKPFAIDMESAAKVIKLAEEKKLRVGSAPDTFLGSAHQTCRKMIDSNLIGKVMSGVAFMMCPGHESWHPSPGFYYLQGGGPLFDMGPYYITALVNMLGKVKRVCAINNRATNLRQGYGVNENKTFPVEVDTHVSAILEFENSAVVNLICSFDVQKHSNYREIELYGTEGSLHVPDPNNFGGEIRFFKKGLTKNWADAQDSLPYNTNSRALGLADMIDAIENNREHRCNGKIAYHVLEVMCGIIESGKCGRSIDIQSSCSRPEVLDKKF
ncbi:MAG: Gfo/Idh/MocA family oxidoreductase [Lentisphaeria bacterium]|nr:Gfo/Idh/MocA family oxidoreductase [Lentisphaeria bacterium]